MSKPPRVSHPACRRIIRDTIQQRIAKAQLRRSLVSGKGALREIDAEIDALLWCLGELNGLPDGPDREED